MDNGDFTTRLLYYIGALCCVIPLLWSAFVFWAGKGFPGWPWRVSVARRNFKNYYEDEGDE